MLVGQLCVDDERTRDSFLHARLSRWQPKPRHSPLLTQLASFILFHFPKHLRFAQRLAHRRRFSSPCRIRTNQAAKQAAIPSRASLSTATRLRLQAAAGPESLRVFLHCFLTLKLLQCYPRNGHSDSDTVRAELQWLD